MYRRKTYVLYRRTINEINGVEKTIFVSVAAICFKKITKNVVARRRFDFNTSTFQRRKIQRLIFVWSQVSKHCRFKFCASLRDQNALGHVTRAILCENVWEKNKEQMEHTDQSPAFTHTYPLLIHLSLEPRI